jgi:hypothetical protein
MRNRGDCGFCFLLSAFSFSSPPQTLRNRGDWNAKAENRKQKTESRKQKAENRKQKTEIAIGVA